MGELLDQAMRSAFPRGKPIRFVQIGGNDGVIKDPLYDYHVKGEFDFEWGHIFEPIPEYFENLCANMRPFSYITCHELAVDAGDMPGTREFSYVSGEDVSKHHLPSSAVGVASFSLQTGATAYPKYQTIKPYIRTIAVKTIPMSELITRYADTNMLITDCEGYDTTLIEAAFRDGRFRPELVQFEDHGQNRELLKTVLDRLHHLGYRTERSHKDYVCQLN
jgi:FkbM family methyltransferase